MGLLKSNECITDSLRHYAYISHLLHTSPWEPSSSKLLPPCKASSDISFSHCSSTYPSYFHYFLHTSSIATTATQPPPSNLPSHHSLNLISSIPKIPGPYRLNLTSYKQHTHIIFFQKLTKASSFLLNHLYLMSKMHHKTNQTSHRITSR